MSRNVPIADTKPDHEETYDEWFRRKAQEGLDRANGPDAKWFTHEEVVARAEARRKELLALGKNEDVR